MSRVSVQSSRKFNRGERLDQKPERSGCDRFAHRVRLDGSGEHDGVAAQPANEVHP